MRNRCQLPLLLCCLLLVGHVAAAGRSGGGFGGRSSSSSSRSYSVPRSSARISPRIRLSPPSRRRSVAPARRTAPTRRVTVPARPRTVIVHHTTYSSAYPYAYLGFYWPHPQAYYPAGTVFLDDAPPPGAVVTAQSVRRGFPWGWVLLLFIVVLLVVLALWARRWTKTFPLLAQR